MIEKWLLVFLIVGGTSLVFLICFPIDFYLYRRRKRQARERNKFPNFEPKPATRAGQCHASVEVKDTIASVWAEDIRRKNVTKGGFAKVVSMIRKKQQEEKITEQMKSLSEAKQTSAGASEAGVHVPIDESIPREQMFPDISCYGKDRAVPSGSDDNYCRDSSLPIISQRRFSNISAAWNENEELVDKENRSLNYGALKILDHEIESVFVDNKQECYTIPMVPPATMMFVRSGEENSLENNTDTDEMQMSSASEPRYTPPSDKTREFSHHVNSFGKIKYSKMVAKSTSESDLMIQTFGSRRCTSDSSSEDALTEPTLHTSVTRIASGLGRSSSDQAMIVSHDSRYTKSGKKRSSITPTDRACSSSVEQFIVHESEETDEKRREKPSKRSKKKRKKQSFLKKHSRESLQDSTERIDKY